MQLQKTIDRYLSDRQPSTLTEIEEAVAHLREHVPGPAYGELAKALEVTLEAKAWDVVRILAEHGICTSSVLNFTKRVLADKQSELLRIAYASPHSTEFETILEAAVEEQDPRLLEAILDSIGDILVSPPIRRGVELALSKQSFDCLAAIANHKEVLFSTQELEHFMALTQSIDDARFPLLLVANGAPVHSLPRVWRIRLGMKR